ncbi:HNH endonuclease [Hymenobacter guriensis]|nr:HNH endonuclease [Hymenobacter guriensis]
MNWISQHKRLAIYLRDGLACAYCGAGVEAGTKFTLDHLMPYSLGGSNKETNLVTCCLSCNSARGNRDVKAFVTAVAAYTQQDASSILAGIRNRIRRVLPLKAAKEMVAKRGSCAKVLAELS